MKRLYQSFIFLLLIIGVAFVSCEKDIEFKGKISNPRLVMNSLLTPDSVVSVQLMQSRFILGEPAPFKYVADAEVLLFVNEKFKEQLTDMGSGRYTGNYYPQSGDNIKIEVNKDGFENIFANTVIPAIPKIVVTDSIVTNHKYEEPYDSGYVLKTEIQNMKIRLTLSDIVDEDNYYYIKGFRYIRTNTSVYQGYPINIILSDVLKNNILDNGGLVDEIFGDEYEYEDIDNLFSDRLVDGKDIVFDFSFQDHIESFILAEGEEIDYDHRNKYRVRYEIEIGEMSKDFYHYMISANKSFNGGGSGSFGESIVEPVVIHSNIENGVGILASYNTYRFTAEFDTYVFYLY